MGRWFMGQITHGSGTAFTSLEELLADGDLVGVMDIETRRSLVTSTWG